MRDSMYSIIAQHRVYEWRHTSLSSEKPPRWWIPVTVRFSMNGWLCITKQKQFHGIFFPCFALLFLILSLCPLLHLLICSWWFLFSFFSIWSSRWTASLVYPQIYVCRWPCTHSERGNKWRIRSCCLLARHTYRNRSYTELYI